MRRECHLSQNEEPAYKCYKKHIFQKALCVIYDLGNSDAMFTTLFAIHVALCFRANEQTVSFKLCKTYGYLTRIQCCNIQYIN